MTDALKLALLMVCLTVVLALMCFQWFEAIARI